MSIWHRIFGATPGGWKTQGVNGVGAFDSGGLDGDSFYATETEALKLGAVHSCLRLRSEVVGTLPRYLVDKDKNVLTDHPLYEILHDNPNYDQTPAELWSLLTAHVDMHGNGISVIERRSNKSVIALNPIDCPDQVARQQEKSGRIFYKYGQDKWDSRDILHLRGFSMDSGWGLSRLDAGRNILSSQVTANQAAQMGFKQGLKIGGFFKVAENLTDKQLPQWKERLDEYGKTENAGKWMTLMKGMEPVGGAQFRIKPSDQELLASRYMGIEEICRLFGVPPQLIGHSDKASSWASSIENINLFFLMYSVLPTVIRYEQQISKKLLTPDDRARGIVPKHNIKGLLRADAKTQSLVFASSLQNGVESRNEVREYLDLPPIPGGDEYTIQTNMAPVGSQPQN